MKRYILLVFCILLGFVYFFIPLAYVEGVVGNGGAYGFGRYIEISNAKGDARSDGCFADFAAVLFSDFCGIAVPMDSGRQMAERAGARFSGCCVVPARFRKRRKLCRSVRLRFVECRVFYSLFDT